MNKQQVRNFNLFTIQYPFTAIVSLLHQLSGIVVFLIIPFLLWMLDSALRSSFGFEHIRTVLTNPDAKLILGKEKVSKVDV